ncbi:MAG: O-antigen ligase family protein, partial [Anaerolineae bacterium]|nr:O-antigen ligase family protein [Anaerolineae bacterium]
RLAFISLAIYFVLVGGGAYYATIFPVRVLHHAFVTILLGLWLFGRVRRGQGLPHTPLNRPILALVAVWVISALFSADPRMAVEHLWFPFTHLMMFYTLVDLFQRGRERLVLETQFMLAAMVVFISGIELASWYFGLGIIPGSEIGWANVMGPGAWLPLEWLRVSLALNVSTLVAGYVAPLVTLAAVWGLTTRRRDFRTVLLILAALLLVILLLTFSRGGLLSVLAAAGTVIAFRVAQAEQVTRRIGGRWLALGGMAAAVLFVSGYMIFSITEARSGNRGDEGRLDMWQSAAEITRDDPLTGVGPGLYGRTFRLYRDPAIAQDKLASAHNAYLNTAAETGLPGILVSLWLGVTFIWAWYQQWKQAGSDPQRRRLEGALAALIGMGVHSLVDVFTTTPIVLLMLVLAVYCVASRQRETSAALRQPLLARLSAITALLVILGYGALFIQFDRAQAAYQGSLRLNENAADRIAEAQTIDPAMRLYALQATYITGQSGTEAEAVEAYQNALGLEPTWDVGWMNLAALQQQAGDLPNALESLARAMQINGRTSAPLRWAELAESTGAADDEAIIAAYRQYMDFDAILPLSAFWQETALRREALERYLQERPLDDQYRIVRVFDPQRAAALVPAQPSRASEWWVVGEAALLAGDTENAADAFSQAIVLAPTNGDYYASRARSTMGTNRAAAERDLKLALLLGTVAEYPNAIWAELETDEERATTLRTNALPPQRNVQEFAAVLFSRPALFEVVAEMGRIGPGRAAMQPWYTLAEQYLENGLIEDAKNVYQAILKYAPDETEASEALRGLAD